MPAGKGLEALIPKKSTEKRKSASAKRAGGEGVFFVEVEKIKVGEQQPRKDFPKDGIAELAASIRSHGILQPLVVEKHEVERGGNVSVHYTLLAGERRLRAAKLSNLKQVPVVIRQAADDRSRLLLSLIENVQREDLNPMERAEAFARLRDEFGLSQEEIADRVGKSREAVANTLRLLQLDDTMRAAIRKGTLSEGHARALLAVPEEKREELFTRLSEQNVSVREAEALARKMSRGSTVPRRVADPRRAADEEKLYRRFGVPVRITTRGDRGSIAFSFRNKDQLKELLKRLLSGG